MTVSPMSIAPTFLYSFDITVHRGGGKDEFGDPLPTTDHTVSNCAAAPAGSTEYVGNQATVVDSDTIYAPFDADVTAQDTITVPDGQAIEAGDYLVQGSPQRYRNPFTGTTAGTVIRLTRPTG